MTRIFTFIMAASLEALFSDQLARKRMSGCEFVLIRYLSAIIQESRDIDVVMRGKGELGIEVRSGGAHEHMVRQFRLNASADSSVRDARRP